MRDLKVIFVRDMLPVQRISMLSEDPPTVLLRGEGFSRAYLLLINGSEVTDFTIKSDVTIELVLPEQFWDTGFSTIIVYAESFVATPSSFLDPRVGDVPEWTNGLHKLVQQFAKILMTNPGTSVLHPAVGGGLRKIVGKNFGRGKTQDVIASVMEAINSTAFQIRQSQRFTNVPKRERLKKAEVVHTEVLSRDGSLAVRLILENESGELAATSMGLGNSTV